MLTRQGSNRPGRWFAVLLALCACALPMLMAAPAGAQERVQIHLAVTRLSDEPGGIDPEAARLHKKLQKDYRYKSLQVVRSADLDLAIDEVGGLEMPGGKRVRVKPILIDKKGVLLSVDVEGSIKTDLRVKSDHLVIIGAERHGKGKMVISVEPHF